MVASNYFIANDYDLAFNLQKLFHEYVALYTRLHYPDSKKTVSNLERRELTSKIQEYLDEINLLVMKMKQFQADTKILNNPDQHTLSAAKRGQRETYS